MVEMASNAQTNAEKDVTSNITCACCQCIIHRRFSLLIGPNEVMLDNQTNGLSIHKLRT